MFAFVNLKVNTHTSILKSFEYTNNIKPTITLLLTAKCKISSNSLICKDWYQFLETFTAKYFELYACVHWANVLSFNELNFETISLDFRK